MEAIAGVYKEKFGEEPKHLIRSPGRVNLIGEHVDYMGFPVLPVAITQAIFVAGGLAPDSAPALTIAHALDKFPTATFQTWADCKIPREHVWTNYVLAAFFGILEWRAGGHDATKVGGTMKRDTPLKDFGNLMSAIPQGKHLRLVVDGNLAIAAGVSSSAALVVGTTSAILRSWGYGGDALGESSSTEPLVDRTMLGVITAKAEHHAGVMCGGMDQACIAGGVENRALLINFDPLRVEPKELPGGATWVVANSFSSCEKYASAVFNYNKRVLECKLAGYMIQNAIKPEAPAPGTLRDVMHLAFGTESLDFQAAEELVRKHVRPEPYLKSDIESTVPADRLAGLLSNPELAEAWKANSIFELQRRAVHVYSEAGRVHKFVAAGEQENLQEMGRLLNASDTSLVGNYDAGSYRLCKVIKAARDSGALGARLTGAGWGGCCVSLVKTDDLPIFLNKMSEFYKELRTEGTKTYGLEVAAEIPSDDAECFFAFDASPGVEVKDVC